MKETTTTAIEQSKIERGSSSVKWIVVSPSWKANLIRRPFSVFSKIHLTTKIDDDTNKDWICSKILHEIVHIEQQHQHKGGTFFWLTSYFTSSKFRALAEIQAFGVEYLYTLKCGMEVSWEYVEKMLVEKYHGAFNEMLAISFTNSLRDGSFETIDWKKVIG